VIHGCQNKTSEKEAAKGPWDHHYHRRRETIKKRSQEMSKAHPGFKAVQAKIAKRSGVPMANAGAILAAATRKAKRNPAAVKANPRLKRVKG